MLTISKTSLYLAASAAALFGGCTLSTVSHDDRRGIYGGTAYAPAYTPSGGPYVAPQPVYQKPVNAPLAGNFPNAGQWQWGTTPDGYRTRIWIPDSSYKQDYGQTSAYVPPAYQAPRYNELYKAPRGRYDTIRYPDGRIEHEWRADESSTPLQGYWQLVQGPAGTQRVWITGVEGTANER